MPNKWQQAAPQRQRGPNQSQGLRTLKQYNSTAIAGHLEVGPPRCKQHPTLGQIRNIYLGPQYGAQQEPAVPTGAARGRETTLATVRHANATPLSAMNSRDARASVDMATHHAPSATALRTHARQRREQQEGEQCADAASLTPRQNNAQGLVMSVHPALRTTTDGTEDRQRLRTGCGPGAVNGLSQNDHRCWRHQRRLFQPW